MRDISVHNIIRDAHDIQEQEIKSPRNHAAKAVRIWSRAGCRTLKTVPPFTYMGGYSAGCELKNLAREKGGQNGEECLAKPGWSA